MPKIVTENLNQSKVKVAVQCTPHLRWLHRLLSLFLLDTLVVSILDIVHRGNFMSSVWDIQQLKG